MISDDGDIEDIDLDERRVKVPP